MLSITHEIYRSLDEEYETRGAFFDTAKAFDKVWYEDLLHKLKENVISSNLWKYFDRLLITTWAKSCSKWAILLMDRTWSRVSIRFYRWTFFFSNKYKRLIWPFSIKSKIICKWCISIPCGRKHDQISQRLNQWLSQNKYWGIPTEN